MKIGIAGPGRSGTSLLTLLFSKFGFHTAVEDGVFNEEALAGYESRIDGTSEFEIDKDPWFFEYISELPESVTNQYELILIPVRKRQDAVVSRVSQERTHKVLSMPTDHWKWNSWGNVPGGSVSVVDFEAVNQTLSNGLWDMVEACETRSIPYLFISFPRFAEDFEYFWSKLGHFVNTKISKDSAREIFTSVIDLNKVRIKADDSKTPKVLELEAIITNLQRKIHSISLNNLETHVVSAVAERDSAVAERDSILNSTIWKLFAPYRKAKVFFRKS